MAQLLCGDNDGGVLVDLQRAHDYVIYHLSPKGALKWTYFGHDKLQSHALGFDETLYLVEAGPGHLKVRLIALDGTMGKEKFNSFRAAIRGHTNHLAPDKFSCVPGLHLQSPQAFAFSRLLVNTERQ